MFSTCFNRSNKNRYKIDGNINDIFGDKNIIFIEKLLPYIRPRVEMDEFGYLIKHRLIKPKHIFDEAGRLTTLFDHKRVKDFSGEELKIKDIDLDGKSENFRAISKQDVGNFLLAMNGEAEYKECVSGQIESEKNMDPYGRWKLDYSSCIRDSAIIKGKAAVWNDTIIDGHSIIGGTAIVKDHCYIGGDTFVDEGIVDSKQRLHDFIPQLFQESSKTGNFNFVIRNIPNSTAPLPIINLAGDGIPLDRKTVPFLLHGIDGKVYGKIRTTMNILTFNKKEYTLKHDYTNPYIAKNNYGSKRQALSNTFRFKPDKTAEDKMFSSIKIAIGNDQFEANYNGFKKDVSALIFGEDSGLLDSYISFHYNLENNINNGKLLPITSMQDLDENNETHVRIIQNHIALLDEEVRKYWNISFIKKFDMFSRDLRNVRNQGLFITDNDVVIEPGAMLYEEAHIYPKEKVRVKSNCIVCGDVDIKFPTTINKSIANTQIYGGKRGRFTDAFQIKAGENCRKYEVYKRLACLSENDKNRDAVREKKEIIVNIITSINGGNIEEGLRDFTTFLFDAKDKYGDMAALSKYYLAEELRNYLGLNTNEEINAMVAEQKAKNANRKHVMEVMQDKAKTSNRLAKQGAVPLHPNGVEIR